MRRRWSVLAGLMAVLLWGSASAQENQITVGALWWAASPSLRGADFDGIGQSSVQLFGPMLHVVASHVVLGSTAYFGQSQWTFDDFDLTVDARRSETNVYFGYAPIPQIELLVMAQFGRSNDNDASIYVTNPDPTSVVKDEALERVFRYKRTLYGPVLATQFALGESRLYFSGRFGMLFGEQQWGYTSAAPTWAPDAAIERHETYDTTLTLLQLGLGLRWESGFSVWAGYKMESSGQEMGEESVKGFLMMATLSVM